MEIAAAIIAVLALGAAVYFYLRWQKAEQLAALRSEQLPLEFENLAAKLLEQSSAKLKETSQESLGQLLGPLKERITEFQKKVEETYTNESRERFALKKEIESIVATNEKMRLEAENLTNALKGSSKVQGNWGEHVLAMLLKNSGLREGEEFITQGRDMKLTGTDGQRLQPDIVIRTPDDRHMVIDAKVSLTHYEQFTSAGDDAARQQAVALFLNSVRTHVKGLAAKDYSAAYGLKAPDFVLMFLPIESAYALALQSDGTLHQFAWERNIVLVSPTTLMPILKTVASIWKLERQNKHTLEIAERGGELYNKFVGFVESMEDIGRRIKQTDASYDEAMKRLSTGTGNLVRQAEILKELGVKAKKNLPESLVAAAHEGASRELEKVS